MEKLSQKWAVASFFDDLPGGFEFAKNEVPLHATLAGVFAIDLNGSETARLLEEDLQNVSAFSVTGGETEQWGSVKVALIEPSERFDKLYTAVQNLMLRNGAVFNEPQYLNAGFRPHVTFQRQGYLDKGQVVRVRSVSLVDMFPGSNPDRRRIHTTIRLRENDPS